MTREEFHKELIAVSIPAPTTGNGSGYILRYDNGVGQPYIAYDLLCKEFCIKSVFFNTRAFDLIRNSSWVCFSDKSFMASEDFKKVESIIGEKLILDSNNCICKEERWIKIPGFDNLYVTVKYLFGLTELDLYGEFNSFQKILDCILKNFDIHRFNGHLFE